MSENFSEDSPAKDPKIIVDEDWKTQVQAEKEAADTAKALDSTASDEPSAPKSDDTVDEAFTALVSTLAAQAMMGLGQIPDPQTGHPVVRPDTAKPFIDMLTMLEAKTKGNLSEQEVEMLDGLLHELRMSYLATRNESADAADSDTDKSPKS